MSKNKKKKKRERKILVAALLVAAITITGSTFAWFTSTDEVTNRLTAEADYGVSIVESFAPPKNWIPGQEVNKDVFDVNTGNIAAFVRNDVSGVLSFTYEKLAASFESNKDKAVALNDTNVASIDGATTMEGGAFLAWTSVNTETLGEKVIDHTHGTGWKPTVSGDYIFRRSINGNKFTYAGYHFEKGTNGAPDMYYKIVIGGDTYPTETGLDSLVQSENTSFDINVSSDNLNTSYNVTTGIITGTPEIRYVVEAKVNPSPVSFTYEDSNTTTGYTDNPRLVINYEATMNQLATGMADSSGNTYDASAWAARKEVEYLNALALSNDAIANYEFAKANYDYAVALVTARDKLIEAAGKREQAETAHSGATQDLSGAKTKVQQAASGLLSDYIGLLDGVDIISEATNAGDIIGADVRAIINADPTHLAQCQANVGLMDELYKKMYSNNDSYAKNIKAALIELEDLDTNNITPAQAAINVQTVKTNLASLMSDLAVYKEKYANIIAAIQANPDYQSSLNTAEVDTYKAKIQTHITKAGTLSSAITATTPNKGIEALVADYATYTTAATTDDTAYQKAKEAWEAAGNAYNAAVGDPAGNTGATYEYKQAIESAKNKYNQSYRTHDTTLNIYRTIADESETLIPGHSAIWNTNTATDARITKANNAAEYDYEMYADPAVKTDGTYTYPSGSQVYAMPTESDFDLVLNDSDTSVAELYAAMTRAATTANNAEGVYKDAKAALTAKSLITIYVYLDENVTTNWTFDNNALAADSTKAIFYLNKIVDAGATSAQLIDKVVLAESVKAGAYRDMTFDLNIGLKSVQVTYGEDGETILATATTAELGKTATLADDKNINTMLTWN